MASVVTKNGAVGKGRPDERFEESKVSTCSFPSRDGRLIPSKQLRLDLWSRTRCQNQPAARPALGGGRRTSCDTRFRTAYRDAVMSPARLPS